VSLFEVKFEKIDKIFNHPNADRLEIGKLINNEYEFCIPKGVYKEGDTVIYFPIDSILPLELSDFLGVTNFLSRNRVKTVKLRGSISQGLITSCVQISNYLKININELQNIDLTSSLGVTKYEPPILFCNTGNLVRLPSYISSYDIENAENYPYIFNVLLNEYVWISEKLEGSNFSISINTDKKIYVNSHNYSIIETEFNINTLWKTARNLDLLNKIVQLSEKYLNSNITLRGEIIGNNIQKNIYNIKNHDIYFFDIEINNKILDVFDFMNIIELLKLKHVPTITYNIKLIDVLGDKTLKEYSNGFSILNPTHLREGIVIKPMIEKNIRLEKFSGRLFLKQRSPLYLANEQE